MFQRDAARTTNFLFVIGEDRELTYHVQSSNIVDVNMNETQVGSGYKDLYIPSNKIDTSPFVVQILLSDDLREWVKLYKWMLSCKNANKSVLPNLIKTCELTALDSQNNESVRFIYKDCFPTNLSAIQYSSIGESVVQTCDLTVRFNQFTVVTNDETIEESYVEDNQ